MGVRDMTYVKSDIDNNYYLVRDTPDKINASNTLARIKQNIYKLSDYLYENKELDKYKEYKSYIEQLKTKLQNTIIIESTSDSIYTSYSVNKGEQLVFCIRSRKNANNIHDINLMMYVVLHEMAHIACPEIGHTPLFKKIFAFLANTAVELGMYTKIPFNSQPTEYCGMQITDSVI